MISSSLTGSSSRMTAPAADDAARRVLVELDDDAAHRRAHLRAIDHVAGGADLLLHVVQLRLGGAQLLDGLLRRGGAQLRDLLLGARDALPGVGDARRQLAQLAGKAGLGALQGQDLGLAHELPRPAAPACPSAPRRTAPGAAASIVACAA